MTDTSEKDLEVGIVQYLGDHGYVVRPHDKFNAETALDEELVLQFLFATQPQQWEKLRQQHGAAVRERFVARLVKEIEERGTLSVLRKGVVDLGCRFELAYFKPETTLNEQHQRLYNANILSVMPQTRFSPGEDKSIDVVLFLNGLPILTAELKNPLKGQSVEDAIGQYKKDRDPYKPLLRFRRCLAHMAVDTDQVFMTTRLAGGRSRFIPFNKGTEDGGAGNPDNPGGYKTAYLWEEIWQRDRLLEIVQHFGMLVDVYDDRGRRTGDQEMIYPRYHQLDAVRKMIGHSRVTGPGHNYLVQHSAGSGKSKTISWLCHRLAGLHDAKNERVFDTIIVISDRRVIDRQLQRELRGFEQVKGTVETVEQHKSRRLADVLSKGADIVVTTLQTFPFVLEKLSDLHGKHFAVVIDEAHSSQSGETQASLKAVLSKAKPEGGEGNGEGEPDPEEAINAAVEEQMTKRGRLPHVSFFAFTATPKPKTLELFGTRGEDGQFRPFHLYSMKQAIEEKFILDVLKNYTTFRTYFELIKNAEDDPMYERSKGVYLARSYADTHRHAIRQKTEHMIDHFHRHVAERIGKRAKAMVVCLSRLQAARFKLAFDEALRERRLPYQALVAFTGTVADPESGLQHTEAGMNGGIPESQTVEEFKKPECRFLIVAEKFQTGFDQPLLHTMYVHKKLSGVNAVQTLSRLNRTRADKDDTCVLDYVNEADDIQEAFQPYYQTTLLTEATDPNKLHDVKRVLEEFHIFAWSDVEAFAREYFSPKGRQERLHALLDPVVQRFCEHEDARERESFRSHLRDYVRLYAFLSQLLTFTDIDLEKLYQFARFLVRKLPIDRGRLPLEIIEKINMDAWKMTQTSSGEIKLIDEDGELKPISNVGSRKQEEEQAALSQIVEYVNEHFGTQFTDSERLRQYAEDFERRLIVQEGLRRAMDAGVNPSPEQRQMAFRQFFDPTLEDMFDINQEMYKRLNNDPAFNDMFRHYLFERVCQVLQVPGA